MYLKLVVIDPSAQGDGIAINSGVKKVNQQRCALLYYTVRAPRG